MKMKKVKFKIMVGVMQKIGLTKGVSVTGCLVYNCLNMLSVLTFVNGYPA